MKEFCESLGLEEGAPVRFVGSSVEPEPGSVGTLRFGPDTNLYDGSEFGCIPWFEDHDGNWYPVEPEELEAV